MKEVQVIEALRQIIAHASPAYQFEYEPSAWQNVKAEYVPREGAIAFVDEIMSGSLSFGPSSRVDLMSWSVVVNFGRFDSTLDNEAYAGDTIKSRSGVVTRRTQIRDRIYNEAVWPFVQALRADGLIARTSSITFNHPPSMFDANEVLVQVRFSLQGVYCE